jgi:hypothetical protein
MVAYIDAHKDEFGVEPICATLQLQAFGLSAGVVIGPLVVEQPTQAT